MIFTACIVQLHCNNGAYSCPVKRLNKNSEKDFFFFFFSFQKSIVLKERVTRSRKISRNVDIPLICALSLAGFDTKLHLKLRRRCSLKCHDFTSQSGVPQVKKGHLILLSVISFDVGKFPPPEPSSGWESSLLRGAALFFGHHDAISDSEA